MADWWIYQGSGEPHDGIKQLPPPPHWRRARSPESPDSKLEADPQLTEKFKNAKFQVSPIEVDAVNTALYLRRPLLVTGPPGTGKSTLASAIAHELKLGKVLEWPITTRSTLQDALYRYDAIGRLQEANLRKNQLEPQSSPDPDIGQFIRLGPLGTAFIPSKYPRVLLIDEIDKSDIDLPNDLLHILEQGELEIPELARLAVKTSKVNVFFHSGGQEQVAIEAGKVSSHAFPIVVMTSNGEREFPPPFLRRCIRLEFPIPGVDKLRNIVHNYFGSETSEPKSDNTYEKLIQTFMSRRQDEGYLATDQLLNAIYLAGSGVDVGSREELVKLVMQPLTNTGNK